MSQPLQGVICRFFVGGADPLTEEADTLTLGTPDGYNELPAKVLAFFREALRTYDFEWLFKCDDDTYLSKERLFDLISPDYDLVGNEFLTERGAPSGGAGYLLSRKLVERLATDGNISPTGAEDLLIGEAALRLGAVASATERLCWNSSRYPQRNNDVVTSHWCSPARLRAIHASLHEVPELIEVVHPYWSDTLALYPGGIFMRRATQCSGSWASLPNDEIRLDWFDWGCEFLSPSGIPRSYHCTPAKKAEESVEAHVRREEVEQEGQGSTPAVAEVSPTDTIAIFLTTSDYGLPHVDSFLRHNPLVPLHVFCNAVSEGEARTLAWRNADQSIRTWWLNQGRHLDFKHAVFLEWDVVFASSVSAVFPGEADFYCKDLKKPGESWNWFEETSRFPETIQPHATGTAPLAVVRLSRRCLSAMFSHPMEEMLYGSDIFCELRLATLAAACGYEPVECPGTLSKVDCGVVQVDSTYGVWHAVKRRQP